MVTTHLLDLLHLSVRVATTQLVLGLTRSFRCKKFHARSSAATNSRSEKPVYKQKEDDNAHAIYASDEYFHKSTWTSLSCVGAQTYSNSKYLGGPTWWARASFAESFTFLSLQLDCRRDKWGSILEIGRFPIMSRNFFNQWPLLRIVTHLFYSASKERNEHGVITKISTHFPRSEGTEFFPKTITTE